MTRGPRRGTIRPAQLWVWTPGTGPGELDDQLTRSVGTAWGLTRIKEGDSLERAASSYRDQADHVARTAIEAVYAQLGVEGRDAAPSGESRERAKRLLDGNEMHHPGWMG